MTTIPHPPAFLATFESDHRHTEAGLQFIESLVLQGEWEKAQDAYGRLHDDLVKHFALEEQALFTELSGYQTMILMELEHDHLLVLMDELLTALDPDPEMGFDAEQITRTFEALKTRLIAHILEEDRGVYPTAEAKLTESEQTHVLQAIVQLDDEHPDWRGLLTRPEPTMQVDTVALFAPGAKPIQVQTLFESGHDSVKLYQLQAGQSLAPHWAGEESCYLVLAGEGVFQDRHGVKTPLAPGVRIQLSPRLVHSLQATTDLSVLQIRNWPHPHFSKVPGKTS